MSTKEKLINRFCRLPSDFSFDELVRLFELFGYRLKTKGKTSGSRVMFVKGEDVFDMHKPHPGSTVNRKVLFRVYKYLIVNGFI